MKVIKRCFSPAIMLIRSRPILLLMQNYNRYTCALPVQGKNTALLCIDSSANKGRERETHCHRDQLPSYSSGNWASAAATGIESAPEIEYFDDLIYRRRPILHPRESAYAPPLLTSKDVRLSSCQRMRYAHWSS